MSTFPAVLVGVAMSLVSFTPASLDEALRDSSAVIVAERAGAKWRVVEVMYFHGDPGQAAPSGTITVADAHVDFNEQVAEHIKQHGYQGVPSPIWPRYTTSLDDAQLAKTKRVILFLKSWRKDWRFAIEGGWESLAKKDAIAAAIAKGGTK
jgi:hypothetical protein